MNVPDCHTYFNFICFHNYIIMQYANTGNGILKKKNARTLLQVQASQETSSQKTRPAISDKPRLRAFRFGDAQMQLSKTFYLFNNQLLDPLRRRSSSSIPLLHSPVRRI